jgi:hypothetical protein
MAVVSSDLHFWLSASGASEGGARSATEVTDAVDNNVFADVSDVSRLAGGSQVRKIFVSNENGVDSYGAHAIWVLAAPTNCTPYIGLGFDDADDASSTAGTLVDFSGAAKVSLISNGSDTRTCSIFGLVGTTPTQEDIVLAGAAEVLSVASFTHVYALLADSISASRTVTIKEGSAGTTRGTIPVGLKTCFRWLTPASAKTTGLQLPALPTGQADGIWERFDWIAGAGAISANDFALKTEAL